MSGRRAECRRNPIATAGLAVLLAISAAACTDSGPSRGDVVGAMTNEVVPSRYAAAAVAADAVVGAIDQWCDGGDPAVVNEAVATARGAWVELRPFSFGPATDRRSMFVIDPQIRVDDVDALGEAGQAVDADSLREFAGADERGWRTVEHLAAGEPTKRRCEYARGAAQLSADELALLADEWVTYGPGLAEADAVGTALRNIVSESIFAARMAADIPDPALDDHRLAGIRMAVLGGEDGGDEGISPLLTSDLVDRLVTELDAGNAADLQITLSTDVAGELGITVNFSDADGDG